MNWPELLHRITTTRYTAWLEDEVERLRQENRGMLNSLLVRGGVQPIDAPPPPARIGRRMSRNQLQMQIEQKAYAEAIHEAQANARAKPEAH